MKKRLLLLFLFAALPLWAAKAPADKKLTPEQWMKERRTKPVFHGEFEVGLYFVDFPDTVPLDVEACLARQSEGVADYFKHYTEGICWPAFKNMGTYLAPQPRGYYLRYDARTNRLGWNDEAEGNKRAAKLRTDAIKNASGSGSKTSKTPPVVAVAYASKYRSFEELEKVSVVRDKYPKLTDEQKQLGRIDLLTAYAPQLEWSGPLWPTSAITLTAEDGAGTFIHELGHVLGAPDYYHATEIKGGVPGTPITIGGGPTGPLYCRWKHCAVVPENAYRLITAESEITLAPRWSHYEGANPLGVFIPTAHPNYLLHLEYEPGRANEIQGQSEGNYGAISKPTSVSGGVHAYYIHINPLEGGCYMGHPDAAYSYRANDPYLHGTVGGAATFREGDTFDKESDPASILPNQLATGVTIQFGEQTLDGAKVTISAPPPLVKGPELTQSLLPIVELGEITSPHVGSFVTQVFVRFRGEPLLTERGVVYGVKPHPTVEKDMVWPLQGIGYDNTRVTGLVPGKYYVRAYAKSPRGVSYSANEEEVTVPATADMTEPLLVHRFPDAWCYTTSSVLPSLWMLSEYSRKLWSEVGTDDKNAKKGAKPKPKKSKPRKGEKLPAPNRKPVKVDYNHVHGNPHRWRYPPTLAAWNDMRSAVQQSLADLGMNAEPGQFPDDFEKNLQNALNVICQNPPADATKDKAKKKSSSAKAKKPPAGKGKYYAYDRDNTDVSGALPEVKAALAAGVIPYAFRFSAFTSAEEILDVCLIDGYREEGGEVQLHLTYAFGRDRFENHTHRKTGWHEASALLDKIWYAYLVVPYSPPAKLPKRR